MGTLSRRSVLRASLGLAAAGSLARPYIANAQAKTATVWWTQGFVPEEDDAFRKVVADYENVSGNKIEFSRHFGPNILEQRQSTKLPLPSRQSAILQPLTLIVLEFVSGKPSRPILARITEPSVQ